MDAVFEHFCLLLKFLLVSDLLLLLRIVRILEILLISITYFSCIAKHFINRKSLIHCYSHIKVWVESNSTTGS